MLALSKVLVSVVQYEKIVGLGIPKSSSNVADQGGLKSECNNNQSVKWFKFFYKTFFVNWISPLQKIKFFKN